MSFETLFLTTYTGKQIHPTDFSPDLVHIIDIAHALSKIDRYNGHLPMHYSVAQHSVLVSYLCPPSLAFRGLMHDAPEYILGDLIRSVKRIPQLYAVWEPIESYVMGQIAAKFEFDPKMIPEIKKADNLAALMERRDLQGYGVRDEDIELFAEIPPVPIIALNWQGAKQMFLNRFEQLSAKGWLE